MKLSSSFCEFSGSAAIAHGLLGDHGDVIITNDFELLVSLVEDLEEEHPVKLLQALGIAGDAGVFVP